MKIPKKQWGRTTNDPVPEIKPDFEKFKREYLDKAPPLTEEELRSIEERNRKLLARRPDIRFRIWLRAFFQRPL